MKTKKQRISPPANIKILEFWCSEEGKKILEQNGITPYGIDTLTVDAGEECWGCNRFCCEGYYDSWEEDKKAGKWSGDSRERCHIIARSLGGTYDCNNLFLMCGQCHRRAPNTSDPRVFFDWVVKENKASIQYKNELSRGLVDIAKELFRPRCSNPDFNSDEFKQWSTELFKFNEEFLHGEGFTKYCKGKISTHGFGGRFHPDILASELGLYKQYCIENKPTLFPSL